MMEVYSGGECMIVAKVEGSEELRFLGNPNLATLPQNRTWWATQLGSALFFLNAEEAEGQLQYLRYQMEQYLGYDLKTKKEIKEVAKGTPLRRIDIPLWAFNLLGLGGPEQSKKLEGKATLYVTEVKLALSGSFIEIEGKFPTEETRS